MAEKKNNEKTNKEGTTKLHDLPRWTATIASVKLGISGRTVSS